jgi:NAD(P)H dehydrogenase (quinone)
MIGHRPRRALVVVCTPVPDSYTAARASVVIDGLTDAGVQVRVRDLYAEGFDPHFSAAERRDHLVAGTADDIADHAEDLMWCDTLVLVYPTWWSAQPAMLKGWFDRVWACGVAWDLPPGANRLRPRLANVRRIVAVTTHGSSKLVNSLQGEAGKRTVTRSLRLMCHWRCRTSWWATYSMDRLDDDRRRIELERLVRRTRRLTRHRPDGSNRSPG